jgi:hypothetical protein
MKFKILLLMVVFGIFLSACHTTRIGQNLGFPSPEERRL